MKTSKFVLLMLVLALTALGAMAQTDRENATKEAVPYPREGMPQANDLGALKLLAPTTPISVTIALKLPNLTEAEELLDAVNTRGNAQFHKFLTTQQFAERFAPTDADVAKVVAGFAKYGLTAERTTPTTLKVTGLPENMERAFSVNLHSYEVPAHDNVRGYTYHAPLERPTIPGEVSASVSAVVGLDSRPRFHPNMRTVPPTIKSAKVTSPAVAGNPPGFLTVTDFANYYDVQPLYKEGITGSGRTIGIITLASFTPSDAFTYWADLGLSVNPSRIHIVNVDGGPGAPSDFSGSDETTLDVEQSGGIAPGANIIVYQAPNTDQGFVDAFATAIFANAADSLSVSWGAWEWFYNYENSPVTDPTTGGTDGAIQAIHELLVQAGLQGQSPYAAAGDSGAYEITRDLGCTPPVCSITLSILYPASDPAITAAGGTTLPVTLYFCLNEACTPPYYPVTVPQERVWGWDYLEGLCSAVGYPNPILCGIFSAGGGGGVSIFFKQPSYQDPLLGVQRTQPMQAFTYDLQLQTVLPSNFSGRNTPDVSFNADPETGYVIFYTSSEYGFLVLTFYGGTSFVAPQLNGVTALLGQSLGGRVGLLNYPLYALAKGGQGWNPGQPLRLISVGDNWFYVARNGYAPAAGLGTLDVALLAKFLQSWF